MDRGARPLLTFSAFYGPLIAYGALAVLLGLEAHGSRVIAAIDGLAPHKDLADRLERVMSALTPIAPNEALEAEEPVGGGGFLAAFVATNFAIAALPLIFIANRWFWPMLASVQLFLFAIQMTIAYAFIYQIGGLRLDGAAPDRPDFTLALFMSVTMMSSLGFGDTLGHGPVRLYIASQALFGVLMIGAAIGLVVSALAQTSANRTQIYITESRDRALRINVSPKE